MAEVIGRPVLLAHNSSLNPYLPFSAGWHLWKMLRSRVPHATRRDFVNTFETHRFILPFDLTTFRRRVVLILGGNPKAFGLAEKLVNPQVVNDVIWRQLPLPGDSWYNDPTNKHVASMVLESMYFSQLGKNYVHN
jgi:hypothetical protein